MRSHVDDREPDHEPLFSRDCAEYEVTVPGGEPILVMVNHFKSKGYGRQADNDARRRAQATRVAAIYDARRAEGATRIAVMGDLNDTPDSAPLQPLLAGTDLRDVSEHPAFDGRRPHGHVRDDAATRSTTSCSRRRCSTASPPRASTAAACGTGRACATRGRCSRR